MTDLYNKRFTYVRGDGFEDFGNPIDAYTVLDLLNKFDEENKKLKKEVEDLKQALIRCAFDEG